MSSRLARDTQGRLVVIVTTPSVGLEVGQRFLVLGDAIAISVGALGACYFLSVKTGWRNTITSPRRSNRDPLPVEASRGPIRRSGV